MGNESNNGKVPLISKIAYGFGDVGCNFSWMFVSNFLMIFYTDVFGISMAAVSALMLFSRFWDAINDPIVGGLTDKTHTRWGRYRPWLLVAAAYYSDSSGAFFLGTPGLVKYSEDYLYGDYLLPAGIRLYLCKYSIWNTLWCYDTGY